MVAPGTGPSTPASNHYLTAPPPILDFNSQLPIELPSHHYGPRFLVKRPIVVCKNIIFSLLFILDFIFYYYCNKYI